jgi:hypothetical protein
MSDTPFIPRLLTPAEFLKKASSTMENCYSLSGISKPKERKLKRTLHALVEKIGSDKYYSGVQKPIKLSNMFILWEDFNNPFAILNYGDEGIEMLRILSLIDSQNFGKDSDYIDPDYIDENQDSLIDLRELFDDLPY